MGPGEEELSPGPHLTRRTRLGLSALAAVVLAGLAAGLVSRHGGGHPGAVATHSRTAHVSRPPAPAGPTGDPVVLTPTGPRPDVGSVRLFARAVDAVVEFNFSAGWIVSSPLPVLLSSGPVTFGLTSTGSFVRPDDAVPGYFVPAADQARPLTGTLAATAVLPGPAPGVVWTEQSAGNRLTGLRAVSVPAGARMPGALRVPAAAGKVWGPPMPDGSGYALITGRAGTFDLRPHGAHRLPIDLLHDTLLASGGNRLLVSTCAQPRPRRCPVSLIRLPAGPRTELPGLLPVSAALPAGAISADGRSALVYQITPGGERTVRLLDLRTGRLRGAAVPVDVEVQAQACAFSPDGRWAFVVSVGGTLTALDTRTGVARRIHADLPHLYQLAVRP